VINSNVLTRLEWFTDPFGVSDPSSWERKYVAQQAWDKIADRPFLGSGTGSSYDAYTATHNQYLSFMLDHGLIGAMILPLLILAATWGSQGEARPLAIVFSCVILMLSLFTHLILGPSFFSMPLFSLMAAMAAISRNQEGQRTVITERKESVPARQLVNA
jgi:O-antigen ligase